MKSEFERRLDEEVAEEKRRGVEVTRCSKCGNKFEYCTCGGKAPWDCAVCIAGRGKGPIVGKSGNKMVRADKLCPKHAKLGTPCRNRAERRLAMKQQLKKG